MATEFDPDYPTPMLDEYASRVVRHLATYGPKSLAEISQELEIPPKSLWNVVASGKRERHAKLFTVAGKGPRGVKLYGAVGGDR